MSAIPLKRPWRQRWFYAFLSVASFLAGLVFFRLRFRGRHHIPREGSVLVCANHQSVMDPVLVGLSVPRRLNFLARRTLFHRQPLAWLITYLDAIPIDREGMGLEGIKETLRRLKRGEMVLIFPEGTRTHDGNLQPLKPGFQAVARRSRATLLPVGVDGAYQAWPRGARWPRLTRIAVQFGEPITGEQIASMTPDELLDQLQQRMQDCLEGARELRRGGPMTGPADDRPTSTPTSTPSSGEGKERRRGKTGTVDE